MRNSKKILDAAEKMNNKKGMEMVQVGILIAIAIGVGIIFKTQITDFVDGVFIKLGNSGF